MVGVPDLHSSDSIAGPASETTFLLSWTPVSYTTRTHCTNWGLTHLLSQTVPDAAAQHTWQARAGGAVGQIMVSPHAVHSTFWAWAKKK